MWTVVLLKPGDDPDHKKSGEEFTQGVVISFVDDLLIVGWQHHIDAVTSALLAKYVMKRSRTLSENALEGHKGIDFK